MPADLYEDIRQVQLIPVIDLKGGVVVRGVAGQRTTYRPVESLLGCDATPESVARSFEQHFGFKSVYIADLDAIAGAIPDWGAYEAIARHIPNLTIDAGVNDAETLVELFPTRRVSEESENNPLFHSPSGRVEPKRGEGDRAETSPRLGSPPLKMEGEAMLHNLSGSGKTREAVVIGLESLTSIKDLDLLLDAIGEDRAVFSLDLKVGRPITSLLQWADSEPAKIANDVVQAGFKRLIVLDLAQVGIGQGPTVCELCRQLRHSHPSLHITSGGGVRGKSDLIKLADSGCDAALVASALHNGNLTPSEVGDFE